MNLIPSQTPGTDKGDFQTSTDSGLNTGSAMVNFSDLPDPKPDLVCFSHLRWDFVFQRPQHLMTRFAAQIRVFFLEEPMWEEPGKAPFMDVQQRDQRLWVIIPHLPGGLSGEEVANTQRTLLDKFLLDHGIQSFVAWYYTPMALSFSDHLKPMVTVYDCMDELSAFKGAPPELLQRERELFTKSDLVYTGGQSLYEAKRDKHPHVFAFPSSIEHSHFAQARNAVTEPQDQAAIPHLRFGFYGVVDERFDLDLLKGVAEARPDWHYIILGPVVKINPNSLPQADNIHYLGMKSYQELPQYLSGWDIAMLPFAMNESTKFISPTKTPEYLAAGKPVVSTPIRDVVRPYGDNGLVRIANDAESFIKASEQVLEDAKHPDWLAKVDQFLSENSWDKTWAKMAHFICQTWMEKESGESAHS
jgi:UDP-galactopyranose mutase